MENMDLLPPTAPSLVFERETYTPYNESPQRTNPSKANVPFPTCPRAAE